MHGEPLASGKALPTFAALILAGGQGRRWGRPKAWARLADERTFLQACVETMASAGASPVAATLPPGADEAMLGSWARDLHALPLPSAELDMFGSLTIGLTQLECLSGWQAVIVMPVDHPLAGPDTVRRLVRAGPPAAVPCFEGRRGHPVSLWRSAVSEILARRINAGNLRQVLRRLSPHEVVVDDPGVTLNLNRPHDLERASWHGLVRDRQ